MRTILHCDLNNFFASVECKLRPELSQFPLAVCGSVEDRHGIVLAKNYKAKAFNIITGEPVWQAKQKCPNLVIVHPNNAEYVKFSALAREIYHRYTDLVEPFGIDECWLDVTGSRRVFGDGEQIAHKIKEEIKNELGITASVGVSFNKIFAKLGSDLKKPDAVSAIPVESFKEIVWGLPVGDLLGVGWETAKKLRRFGINTIGELANFPPKYLQKTLGKCGVMLWIYANGNDCAEVVPYDMNGIDKSVGHGTTARADIEEPTEVWRFMLSLSQEIGKKLYFHNKKALGVAISVRDNTLSTKIWQTRLPYALQSPSLIARAAFDLFSANYDWANPIRSLTVRAIDLIPSCVPSQFSLFLDPVKINKIEKIDRAVDRLRLRYGDDIVKAACLLDNGKMSTHENLKSLPRGI